MKYFEDDFIKFFEELTENNNKAWFDENRKRYLKIVKDPLNNLTTDLIAELSLDDNITMQAKDAIFRINRDIRFSADKTPYKNHVGAIISAMTKKDNFYPGYYFQIGHTGINIAGGIYQADKHQILNFRTYIANNLNEFREVINDERFVKYYGQLQGEKSKIIPKDFKEIAKKESFIANKQLYYWTEINKKHITSNNLKELLVEYYYAAKDVKDFLTKAVLNN